MDRGIPNYEAVQSCWRRCVPPKRWQPHTRLHGVTFQDPRSEFSPSGNLKPHEEELVHFLVNSTALIWFLPQPYNELEQLKPRACGQGNSSELHLARKSVFFILLYSVYFKLLHSLTFKARLTVTKSSVFSSPFYAYILYLNYTEQDMLYLNYTEQDIPVSEHQSWTTVTSLYRKEELQLSALWFCE